MKLVARALLISVALGASLAERAAIAEAMEPDPRAVCGRAWSERGFHDGAAGREPAAHPFGAEEAAAATACAAHGLSSPSFQAYAAQYGAGRFLSRKATKPAAGAASTTAAGPSARVGPLNRAPFPTEGLAAAGADPLRCRPAAAQRAGRVGAPPPIDCGVFASPRLPLRDRYEQGRRDRAYLQQRQRLDSERLRLRSTLMRPTTNRAERKFVERRLRDVERARRALQFRRIRPPLP